MTYPSTGTTTACFLASQASTDNTHEVSVTVTRAVHGTRVSNPPPPHRYVRNILRGNIILRITLLQRDILVVCQSILCNLQLHSSQCKSEEFVSWYSQHVTYDICHSTTEYYKVQRSYEPTFALFNVARYTGQIQEFTLALQCPGMSCEEGAWYYITLHPGGGNISRKSYCKVMAGYSSSMYFHG